MQVCCGFSIVLYKCLCTFHLGYAWAFLLHDRNQQWSFIRAFRLSNHLHETIHNGIYLRHLNNASYSQAHSLIGKPYLAIIAGQSIVCYSEVFTLTVTFIGWTEIFSFLVLKLRAYSHQTKAGAKATKSKQKRSSKIKRQTSKKIFAFASTFARCEWALRQCWWRKVDPPLVQCATTCIASMSHCGDFLSLQQWNQDRRKLFGSLDVNVSSITTQTGFYVFFTMFARPWSLGHCTHVCDLLAALVVALSHCSLTQ